MAIGGVVLNFAAKTTEAARDIGKLTGALDNVRKKAGGADTAMGKMGKAAKIGIAGAVAGAAAGIGIFVNFAKAAIDDAAAQDKLAASLKKSTKATAKGVDAAEDWIMKTQLMTGVADDELRPALERAARSTKNLKGAQKLVSLALDISARTGKPLAIVMKRLAAANDGNIKGLKGLGITLGDNASNAADYAVQQAKLLRLQNDAAVAFRESGASSKDYQTKLAKVADQQKIVNDLAAKGIDWQKELGDEFGGAAAKAGGTLKGTWERIKVVFAELGESIGNAALPPLQLFADWFADKKNISKVQGWINKVGEWSTAIGTEFAGKLQEFVKWLGSPEGHTAMQNFADDLKQIADGFVSVLNGIKKFAGYLDTPLGRAALKAFGILHGIGGFDPLSGPANTTAPGHSTREDYDKADQLTGHEGFGGRRTSSKGGGTVVNIYNPKPERASTSVAAGLRVSRPNTVSV
jgi:DNA-binding ferritin-like protein